MAEEHGYLPEELEQYDRNLEYASEGLRNKSINERCAARWSRQEVKLRSRWDEHDNRMRLQDRIDNVRAMRTHLQQMRDMIVKEHQDLTAAKNVMDKGLTGRRDQIMNVLAECQSLNVARQGINNVHDEVGDKLRLEEELAAHIRRELEKKSQESIRLLEELQNCQRLLERDLEDKEQASNIDQAQVALTTASYGLSLKPNILRIPDLMTTLRQWLEHSLGNLRLAAQLLDKSTVLRNNITALMSFFTQKFNERIHATDFAYRKRYNDTLLAARRLEHNRENLVNELKSVENDIQASETAWNDTEPCMKLEHTRIENRNQRPNHELVLDVPQEGLLLEAANLATNRKELEQKLKELKSRWNDLTEQLHRVELDLERKLKCLPMDRRSAELRKTTFLPSAEKDAIDWLTDRNTKIFLCGSPRTLPERGPKSTSLKKTMSITTVLVSKFNKYTALLSSLLN